MSNYVSEKRIQIDASGVGHCWQTVPFGKLDADVQDIISAEIIDGRRESGKECIGGGWYRWE